MPVGIIDRQKLENPLFTPSTKAEQGAHDENISPEQGRLIFRVFHPFLNQSFF
jgi:phosphoribosylaminoimidazole-succinocarboxamide synthase